MEDDDFTFPTVAPAPPEGQPARDDGDPVQVAHLVQPPLLPDLAEASPLWPFAGSVPKTTLTADRDQEERMDLLWEGTAAAAATSEPSSGAGHAHAEPPKRQRHTEAEGDDDKKRAAAVADAERMDKLWESFNEELLLLRRGGRSRPGPAGGHDPVDDHWCLCDCSPSDAESEETSASSPAERRGYGCAPTMLRASSRAGGAGQFCSSRSSPRSRRRGGRGAAAGWALLLRLFRRLFAVDKTSAPSPRSSSGIYVP